MKYFLNTIGFFLAFLIFTGAKISDAQAPNHQIKLNTEAIKKQIDDVIPGMDLHVLATRAEETHNLVWQGNFDALVDHVALSSMPDNYFDFAFVAHWDKKKVETTSNTIEITLEFMPLKVNSEDNLTSFLPVLIRAKIEKEACVSVDDATPSKVGMCFISLAQDETATFLSYDEGNTCAGGLPSYDSMFSNKNVLRELEIDQDRKTRTITWNENGELTSDATKDDPGLSELHFKALEADKEYFAKHKEIASKNKYLSQKQLKFPKNPKDIRYEEVTTALQKLNSHIAMVSKSELEKFIESVNFEKEIPLYLKYFVNPDTGLSFESLQEHDDGRTHGYTMTFDSYGNLRSYQDGVLWRFSSKSGEDNDLIRLTFHPTGYPATYKTIVKDQLLGRQIEWDDMGEVMSDVNFDTPQPLIDVSKMTK